MHASIVSRLKTRGFASTISSLTSLLIPLTPHRFTEKKPTKQSYRYLSFSFSSSARPVVVVVLVVAASISSSSTCASSTTFYAFGACSGSSAGRFLGHSAKCSLRKSPNVLPKPSKTDGWVRALKAPGDIFGERVIYLLIPDSIKHKKIKEEQIKQIICCLEANFHQYR